MPFPSDVIYRINLAWINTVDELSEILSKHKNHKIFLDLPIRRTKPPENRYSIDDLTPIIKNFSNIRYLAVSNVNSKDDVLDIQNKLPDNITLVPKIESILGIVNIKSITDSIKSKKKIIMLDHDDLYRSIEKNNELISKFQNSINTLIEFCKENGIILLRTRGVIFADD
tara:strand:+ start:2210 stop:2719 length:510 start_codon:yes stop_codon:yes gene_type:complete